jgi:uncharacterized DUF497 family protein
MTEYRRIGAIFAPTRASAVHDAARQVYTVVLTPPASVPRLPMRIDWDEPKRRRNLEIHEIDFADVGPAFEARMLVRIDTRRPYGEARYVGIGRLNAREVVVVWAEHRDIRWIISCRRANAKERARYREAERPQEP